MKHIRISLIGAGMISAKHLAAYQEIPEAQVVAVCSRTQQSAARCAEEWNIPDFCTDVQAMLARDDIDAVDICVHNNLHAPYAIAALRAGTHVYCEKPLAGSYADGLAMVEAARETGKTLHIQLGTLYETATRAAKRLVDGGALGELYHARTVGFRRRNRPFVDGYGSADFAQKQYAGGGALYDFGVNHIALLLYLMGLPTPTRMSGRLYQKIAMDEQRRLESRYDVEEPSVGFVRFDNGATMDLFESWAAHLDSMDPSVLLGSKGGFKLDPFSFHTTLCDTELDCTGDLESMESAGSTPSPEVRLHVVGKTLDRRAAGSGSPAAHRGTGPADHAHSGEYRPLQQAGAGGHCRSGGRRFGFHCPKGVTKHLRFGQTTTARSGACVGRN